MNYEFLVIHIQDTSGPVFPDGFEKDVDPFKGLQEATRQFFKCEWPTHSSVTIKCGDDKMEMTIFAGAPIDIEPGHAFEVWAEPHWACLEELKEFCEAYDLEILDLQTRNSFDIDVEIEDLKFELNNQWLTEEEFDDFDEVDDFDNFDS